MQYAAYHVFIRDKIEKDGGEIMIKLWLKCASCDSTSNPMLTKVQHATGGGYHIKARCPMCGNHIKFVAITNFLQSEIDDLRFESSDLTQGEQYDLFR